jgi:hypothetical protein
VFLSWKRVGERKTSASRPAAKAVVHSLGIVSRDVRAGDRCVRQADDCEKLKVPAERVVAKAVQCERGVCGIRRTWGSR